MKNDYPERPTPLAELARERDPAQVGLHIRSAISAPIEDTPCVKWRIRNTLHRRVERRIRMLRYALVGVAIFITGGMVGAVVQPLFRARASASGPSVVEPATTSVPRHRPRRGSRPPASALEESAAQVSTLAGEAMRGEMPAADLSTASTPAPDHLPLAEPWPPPAAKAVPQPAPRRLAKHRTSLAMAGQPAQTAASRADAQQVAPPPPLATPAPVSPTPQMAERALIATALGKLRDAREPAAALAALDEYRERFPDGVLAPEAARLRTEALLRLGRKATVLDELERTLLSPASADDERLVLRGELRAAAGRWRAALADFDAIVRAHPASAVGDLAPDSARVCDRVERALWGRSTARSHLGDDAGARTDLRQYLRRFPHGHFAAQAARLLEEEPSP